MCSLGPRCMEVRKRMGQHDPTYESLVTLPPHSEKLTPLASLNNFARKNWLKHLERTDVSDDQGDLRRRTLGAAAGVHSRGVGGARGQGFRPRSEAVPQLEPTLHPRLHLRQSAVHEVRTRQRPSHLPAPLHLRGRLFPSHRRDLPHGRRSARTLGSHGRRVGLGTRQRQSVVTSPALKV
jgi:hypothetical protein